MRAEGPRFSLNDRKAKAGGPDGIRTYRCLPWISPLLCMFIPTLARGACLEEEQHKVGVYHP